MTEQTMNLLIQTTGAVILATIGIVNLYLTRINAASIQKTNAKADLAAVKIEEAHASTLETASKLATVTAASAAETAAQITATKVEMTTLREHVNSKMDALLAAEKGKSKLEGREEVIDERKAEEGAVASALAAAASPVKPPP